MIAEPNIIISRLEALTEAAMVLNSTLNLEDILKTNLNYALKLLAVDRGTIYLVDHDKNEIWSKVLVGKDVKEIRLPFGFGLAGYVAQTVETLIIDDVYNDPRFSKDNDLKTGYRSKTMLILPMCNNTGKIIGVMQLINKLEGLFNQSDKEFAKSLASLGAVAIENAMLHSQLLESERLKREMEIAQQIQDRLIPQTLPEVSGYEFSIRYNACTEVGGDYVDVIQLPNHHIALIIADVSGHGVPASLLVSTLQASLHAYLEAQLPMKELVGRLNSVVYRNSTPETYITFFIAVINTTKKSLSYCNAGHPATLLIRDNDKVVPLNSGGPPLGMFPKWDYEFEKAEIRPRDFLFFYTDGISETMNEEEEEFGEERIFDFLVNFRRLRSDRFLNKLWTELDQFANNKPPDDDRTVLLVRLTDI